MSKQSPERVAWSNMIQRCTNQHSKSWPNYGGCGIAVYDRWRNSFDDFLADVGPRPSPSHSLDHRDNDGHYEPGNVRWATPQEQAQNTRRYTGAPSTRYQVRHSADQMAAWQAAAQADGRELQNWIRRTLDEAAKASQPTGAIASVKRRRATSTR